MDTLQIKKGQRFGVSLSLGGYVFPAPLKRACLPIPPHPRGSQRVSEDVREKLNGTAQGSDHYAMHASGIRVDISRIIWLCVLLNDARYRSVTLMLE